MRSALVLFCFHSHTLLNTYMLLQHACLEEQSKSVRKDEQVKERVGYALGGNVVLDFKGAVRK